MLQFLLYSCSSHSPSSAMSFITSLRGSSFCQSTYSSPSAPMLLYPLCPGKSLDHHAIPTQRSDSKRVYDSLQGILVYFDCFSWIVSCSGDWQNADNLCLYLVAQAIDIAAFVYCFLVGFVVAFAWCVGSLHQSSCSVLRSEFLCQFLTPENVAELCPFCPLWFSASPYFRTTLASDKPTKAINQGTTSPSSAEIETLDKKLRPLKVSKIAHNIRSNVAHSSILNWEANWWNNTWIRSCNLDVEQEKRKSSLNGRKWKTVSTWTLMPRPTPRKFSQTKNHSICRSPIQNPSNKELRER